MLLTALAVIWTVGAAIGVVYSFATFRRYRIRYSAVTAGEENGAMRILAKGSLRSERNRLITQSIALMVGIIALADQTPPEWLRAVSRFGIVIAVGLIYSNSVLNKRTHDKALEQVSDGKEKG